MSTIHDRIAQRRSEMGLTQKQLAEKLGVVWQTIQQWENGTSGPKRLRLKQVAEVLDVTPAYLAFGTSINIERFSRSGLPTSDGEFVLYREYAATMEAKDEELAALEDKLSKIAAILNAD